MVLLQLPADGAARGLLEALPKLAPGVVQRLALGWVGARGQVTDSVLRRVDTGGGLPRVNQLVTVHVRSAVRTSAIHATHPAR